MTAANKTKTAAKKTDDSSNYQTNGQTEVREHRFLRMPSMGVRELGRQLQFVLIKCFQSNHTYLYQLTAPFGPWKTVGPTFGPSLCFFCDNLGLLATKESTVGSDGIITKLERVSQ